MRKPYVFISILLMIVLAACSTPAPKSVAPPVLAEENKQETVEEAPEVELPESTEEEPSPEPEPENSGSPTLSEPGAEETNPSSKPAEEKPKAPDSPPELKDVEFVFGSNVPQEIKDSFRENLAYSAHFMESWFGYSADGLDFTSFVFVNEEEIIAEWMRFGNVSRAEAERKINNADGWAGKNYMFFLVREDIIEDEESLAEFVMHEYTHVIQGNIVDLQVGRHDISRAGPRWLTEGIAEYITTVYITEYRGIITSPLDLVIQLKASGVKDFNVSPEAMRTSAEFSSAASSRDERVKLYWICLWAVSQLTEDSNPDVLFAYYENVKQTGSWRVAFEQTFETTIEDFYAEFNNLRSST